MKQTRNWTQKVVASALALMLVTVCLLGAEGREQPPKNKNGLSQGVTFTTLEAFLFFSETGRIGEKNVAQEIAGKDTPTPAQLVNVVVGENTEDGASSTSTVVVVGLKGPGMDISWKQIVLSLRAEAGAKTLLRQTVGGNPLIAKTKDVIRKVPFVIHGTGCEPLHITAELGETGKKPLSKIERVVPFKCFE